jgi:uncharacterized protein (TIGR02266 family)
MARHDAHAHADPQAHAPPDAREHVRHAVVLEITFVSDSQFYVGLTENLSEGGIFVATHALRRPGTLLEVFFSLPDSPEPIRVLGEVRWVREYSPDSDAPPGFGVRFVSLRKDDASRIHAFIDHRPALLFDE